MAPTCQSVQLFSHTECGCVAVTCPSEEVPRTEKPITTLPGTVEKIIKSRDPDEPEKGQIAVEGAEELYREIRIENTLQDEDGKDVALKQGAQVEVTTEADKKDMICLKTTCCRTEHQTESGVRWGNECCPTPKWKHPLRSLRESWRGPLEQLHPEEFGSLPRHIREKSRNRKPVFALGIPRYSPCLPEFEGFG